MQQFRSCLGAKETAARVDADAALGQALNISATPTMFINGRRLVGVKSAAQIEEEISKISRQMPGVD
jgi:protein-disulfide isomerase